MFSLSGAFSLTLKSVQIENDGENVSRKEMQKGKCDPSVTLHYKITAIAFNLIM